MSDPFEAMRIPREQGPVSGQPQSAPPQQSVPAPPQRPGPPPQGYSQQGYQQQGYQQPGPQQPPGYQQQPGQQPPPAYQQPPAAGQRPSAGPLSSRPLPGPSDDPFDQMRVRPETQQPSGAPGRSPSGPGSSQQAQAPAQNRLADVPHLRSYSGSATLGARLLALFVDVVVVALVAVGIWFLLAYLFGGKLVIDFGLSGYLAFAIVFICLNLLYAVGVTLFGASTLGQMAFKLKVVQYNTGEVMDAETSLRRQLLPSVALLVPYVGAVLAPLTYLSALWDPTRLKRDWNDRLTETTWVRRS